MPKKCVVPVFRDLVTIQQDSSDAGDTEPDYTGTAYKTGVACSIEATGGQESYRGDQLEGLIDYVVHAYYISGVTNDMRLSVTGGIYNGKTLNISHVRPKQSDGPTMMEIFCRELGV